MRTTIAFSIFIILLLTMVHAQEFPSYQNVYVNDFAGIFSEEQSAQLAQLFDSIKKDTTAEVVVVTITSSSPYSQEEYRTKLFNYWEIGNKEKDNGLLILYSVQEKRIEVEVGYGLEGILPDSKVGRLLDENYVPLRDSGNITQGIIQFSFAVSEVLKENKEEIKAGNAGSGSNLLGIFIIILFIGLIVYLVINGSRRKKNYLMLKASKKPITEGVKKDNRLYGAVQILSLVLGLILILSNYILLGILFLLFILPIFRLIRGVRCAHDGKRMKYK